MIAHVSFARTDRVVARVDTGRNDTASGQERQLTS